MDNSQLSKPLLSDFKSLERVDLLSMMLDKEFKTSQIKPSSVHIDDKKEQLGSMKEALDDISAVFNYHIPSELNMPIWVRCIEKLSDENHFLACAVEGDVLYIDMKTKKYHEKRICDDELIYIVVLKGEEKAIFSSPTTLYEVNLPSLLPVKEKNFNFGSNIGRIMISPDQNSLYVLVFWVKIVKANLENFEDQEDILQGKFVDMALSRNGELITLSMDGKFLTKWETLNQEKKDQVSLDDNKYYRLELSKSQSKILANSQNTVAIINANPLEVYRVLTIKRAFFSFMIANDENILIVGDNIGKLQFWDIKNEEQLSEVQVNSHQIINVKVSNDGQLIYTNGIDKRICTLNFPKFTKELSASIDNLESLH